MAAADPDVIDALDNVGFETTLRPDETGIMHATSVKGEGNASTWAQLS